MFKTIIFDFDGVILDSEPLHFQACHEAFEAFNIPFTYKEFSEKYIGLADKDLFPQFLNNNGYVFSPEKLAHLLDIKHAAYEKIIRNCPDLPIIEGLEMFLQQLQKEKKLLAICSGSTRKDITILLERLNLASYFMHIVSTEDVRKGKPSPEGFLLAAKRLNVLPLDCLAIEDSAHGIEAAKKAGMKVIALSTSYPPAQLKQADFIAKDFNEIDCWHCLEC
jgi:beta-phosphoglucomutase